jgi:hypothetical protein
MVKEGIKLLEFSFTKLICATVSIPTAYLDSTKKIYLTEDVGAINVRKNNRVLSTQQLLLEKTLCNMNWKKTKITQLFFIKMIVAQSSKSATLKSCISIP